jgi:CheY-like chemotaxis protein
MGSPRRARCGGRGDARWLHLRVQTRTDRPRRATGSRWAAGTLSSHGHFLCDLKLGPPERAPVTKMMESKLPERLRGRRVLVVEDEYFIADDVAAELAALGADVVGPVPDLARAMAFVASSEPIDLAVLDINLQGEAVYPVADALMTRQVPFVFATGYGPSLIPDRYGDVQRWEKPYDHRDLARMLPSLFTS